jgi:hypothetical protein
VMRERQEETLAAQQVMSAALQRRKLLQRLQRRSAERNRAIEGTWADRERRTRVVEDMARRTPEPPSPRRREAILATRAKRKLKEEDSDG